MFLLSRIDHCCIYFLLQTIIDLIFKKDPFIWTGHHLNLSLSPFGKIHIYGDFLVQLIILSKNCTWSKMAICVTGFWNSHKSIMEWFNKNINCLEKDLMLGALLCVKLWDKNDNLKWINNQALGSWFCLAWKNLW